MVVESSSGSEAFVAIGQRACNLESVLTAIEQDSRIVPVAIAAQTSPDSSWADFVNLWVAPSMGLYAGAGVRTGLQDKDSLRRFATMLFPTTSYRGIDNLGMDSKFPHFALSYDEKIQGQQAGELGLPWPLYDFGYRDQRHGRFVNILGKLGGKPFGAYDRRTLVYLFFNESDAKGEFQEWNMHNEFALLHPQFNPTARPLNPLHPAVQRFTKMKNDYNAAAANKP